MTTQFFLLFCLQEKSLGEAGSTIVIEEKLEGEEVSVRLSSMQNHLGESLFSLIC